MGIKKYLDKNRHQRPVCLRLLFFVTSILSVFNLTAATMAVRSIYVFLGLFALIQAQGIIN